MRRAAIAAVLLGLTALVCPGVASATANEVPEPVDRCVVSDPRLDEVSGLAADDQRWYAVNDGGSRLEVYVLGRDCAVQDVITNDTNPYDVEDLALATDGTLWLADTGDNRKVRETVALHELGQDGSATLYRLTYPDRAHDAEALLLGADGVPYIVTKSGLGSSGIYRPAEELTSPGPTPLERVGSVQFTPTSTPGGPISRVIGSVTVTGGAVSADGRVVALRTYTDAYLYPAPDGDVLAALARDPVRVPLPNEQQGEAIAFEPDGALLSASEGTNQPLRAVEAAEELAGKAATSASRSGAEQRETGGTGPEGDAAARSDDSGLATGPALLIAIGIALLLAVGFGRWRRRSR
ncbi:hypothetical protein EV191_102393 [Tamaricihabitans halophyticus]|uniref:Esterase-like activity of phytase family protein n=1 Tax=Tamaricihabitans halophyticus TaxID=1262583 RepID=A0A4R2R6F7_9PSEU|nr:esterase-like activity of phytase family protein [Tamaricihabitans halophyticus]TCP55181.1 hypothetical protein EV191_102393 [Tamaricihabitans halophyticus]